VEGHRPDLKMFLEGAGCRSDASTRTGGRGPQRPSQYQDPAHDRPAQRQVHEHDAQQVRVLPIRGDDQGERLDQDHDDEHEVQHGARLGREDVPQS
jgi:hypothetical protein